MVTITQELEPIVALLQAASRKLDLATSDIDFEENSGMGQKLDGFENELNDIIAALELFAGIKDRLNTLVAQINDYNSTFTWEDTSLELRRAEGALNDLETALEEVNIIL